MPENAVEELNQWGPWCLLAYGVLNILFATFLYRPYLGLAKRVINSAWLARMMERHPLPEFHMKAWRWYKSSIDAPFWRWLGVVAGTVFVAAGLAWLRSR